MLKMRQPNAAKLAIAEQELAFVIRTPELIGLLSQR
jgi:hypothetical protein